MNPLLDAAFRTRRAWRTVALVLTAGLLGALVYASWLSRPRTEPAVTYGAATYGDGAKYGP